MLVSDEGKLLNSSNNNKNRLIFFSGKHETNSCVAPYFSAAQIVVFVGWKSRETEREKVRPWKEILSIIQALFFGGRVVLLIHFQKDLFYIFCRPNLLMKYCSWLTFF